MDKDENGRVIHTGSANLMWGGMWRDIGNVEFLIENGRIVKIVSFTPKDGEELSHTPEERAAL